MKREAMTAPAAWKDKKPETAYPSRSSPNRKNMAYERVWPTVF